MYKNKEYREYVLDHQRNIVKAWESIRAGMRCDELDYWTIHDLVMNHDKSKLSGAEFKAYGDFFYPKKEEDKNKETFQKAWHHHIKENPHHWEYWVIPNSSGCITTPMPFHYVIEMLLDWKAMSYKFGDSIIDFYHNNKHKMILHEKTKQTIDNWINYIHNNGE